MIRNILVLFILPIGLFAQDFGKSSFVFTQVPISAVNSGLGGSQVSIFKNDILQLADNPAFLDTNLAGSFSISYLNYFAAINQGAVGYGFSPTKIGMFSAYLKYYGYGVFTETDEVGNETGYYSAGDSELGVNLTRKYKGNITYGFTFKQLFSSMYSYFAYGLGADAGVYYQSDNKNFSTGFVLNNLGFKLVDYTKGHHEMLPIEASIAVSQKFKNAPFRVGFQYSNIQKWDLAAVDNDALTKTKTNPITKEVKRQIVTVDNFLRHLSASVVFEPNPKFNLFVGYNFRRRLELSIAEKPGAVGFSFGTMMRVKKFGLQYSYSNYHLSSGTNHLAITTNFNEWHKNRK